MYASVPLIAEDDPYPPSLPKMDSPDMALYDRLPNHPAHETFDKTYPSDAPNAFDTFDAAHLFQDATPSSRREYGGTVRPADLSLDRVSSPSSSPASSPNSSIAHQRRTSSNSSRSATFESQLGVLDEARAYKSGLENSGTTGEIGKGTLEQRTTQNDLDLQMNALFDFDSAANSPGGSASTEGSFNKLNPEPIMPQSEQTPRNLERPLFLPHRQSPPVTSGTTSSSFKVERTSEDSTVRGQPCVPNDNLVMQGKPPFYSFFGHSTAPASANNAGFVGPNNYGYPTQKFNSPALPFPSQAYVDSFTGPKLILSPLQPKTRAETQFPIAMTLVRMPPGVTSLHLPARTIAKPKQMAKPPPSGRPDMLELDVMPVCASAIKKPGLLARAFALARGEGISISSRKPSSSSSSDQHGTVQHVAKGLKPTDGGPIIMCKKCLDREHHRAHRSTTKKLSDEELEWDKGEKERIVVFNADEIVDWNSDPNAAAPKKGRKGKSKDKDNTPPGLPIPQGDSAGYISLQMRITCYCRHQGETEGYRVIITLKDHRGNCIAQQLSSVINITDDHKNVDTQPPDPLYCSPASAVADTSYLHGGNSHPSGLVGPVPQSYHLGQSYSTTDLAKFSPHQNMLAHHRSATSVSLQRQAQAHRSRSVGISTPVEDSSYRTSTTMTPRNLSRPVSPNADSGPAAKRHRATGPNGMRHRALVDLSMTQMAPSGTVHAPVRSNPASPDSSSGAVDGLQMSEPRGRTPRSPRPVSRVPDPYAAVNPPTAQTMHEITADWNMSELPLHPSTGYEAFLPGSEAMARVLASHESHIQSPQTFQPPRHIDMTAHAQALHHSLLHVPGAVVPAAVVPTLARVIPSEGPVAGGIDVTIIGDGFRNGMDVLFADAVASKTTVINSQLIICVIPPSVQHGLVPVSIMGGQHSEPPVWFRYVDTNEQDLMRAALSIFHHRNTGQMANSSDIARSILDQFKYQNRQQSEGGAQYRSEGFGMDLELAILGIIDSIDQTESIVTPRYNATQSNGQTMLHIASSLGYHRLVAGLLARGANPDLRDRNGMSAMHMACLQGHAGVVRKLLSAGGDSTLRSLLGLSPIDMARNEEVYLLMDGIARHTRSRSLGATPASHLSRASSANSISSSWDTPRCDQVRLGDIDAHYNDALLDAYRSHSMTPAEARARSRRNSATDNQRFRPGQSTDDPTTYTHLIAASAGLAAWRDHLAGQIQHFQQSVQRTLPNLQIPNLPPLPNFEDYQEHPVVRRISSFVPRMNAPPSPPAYDEIYPENTLIEADMKKSLAAHAILDALVPEKCATGLDKSVASSLPAWAQATREAITHGESEELRLVRARKVKTLSNDRKLFFVWIPLLILVVLAMVKDWAPQVLRGFQHVLTATQQRLAA